MKDCWRFGIKQLTETSFGSSEYGFSLLYIAILQSSKDGMICHIYNTGNIFIKLYILDSTFQF